MKKKKLKKKIKKLKRDVEWLKECERRLAVNHMNFRDSLSKQQDDISKLKDGKFCKDDIKNLNNRIDGVLMDTNYLRTSIQRVNVRCDILDRRTQTNYDKIVTKTDETKNEEKDLKSCSNCKYDGMSFDVAPCYGCTDTNKNMFEPKGENNGQASNS